MNELTWQGEKPSRLRPVGECVLESYEDPAAPDEQRFKIRVLHADPHILISAELLEEIKRSGSPHTTLDGDILKIHGTNRTVIYHIGDKVPDLLAHYAEWPD